MSNNMQIDYAAADSLVNAYLNGADVDSITAPPAKMPKRLRRRKANKKQVLSFSAFLRKATTKNGGELNAAQRDTVYAEWQASQKSLANQRAQKIRVRQKLAAANAPTIEDGFTEMAEEFAETARMIQEICADGDDGSLYLN